MKLNNRDCKIVQDLLPNYIENLTDEITNEYIEEHIATCAECAQVLKDMNGELKLEQIHQEHEIKYLKGIRKRVRRTILAVTIAVILIAGCVIGYVYKKSQIQVNNYTFLIGNYIIENQQGTKDGNLYGTLIAVIDNKGICKSMRVVETGYVNDILKEKLKEIERNNDVKYQMNAMIKGESLHYNLNILNGCNEEEVRTKWTNNYNIVEIKEI